LSAEGGRKEETKQISDFDAPDFGKRKEFGGREEGKKKNGAKRDRRLARGRGKKKKGKVDLFPLLKENHRKKRQKEEEEKSAPMSSEKERGKREAC